MATNVILPVLGMAQDSGKIVQWLRAEGDLVQQGEPLAEIETDKVTVELEAPASGTLAQLRAAAGEEVPVGQVIAVILAANETAAPVLAPASAPQNGHAQAPQGQAALPTTTELVNNGRRRQASPKARRLAEEYGIDLAGLHGSGPNGVVVAGDVLAASAAPAAPVIATAPVVAGAGISTAWRIMAERTTQSWTTIPHFFLFREVEATALRQWHAAVQKRSADKVTVTDLLIKVVATALRDHPRVNSSWQHNTIVANATITIGLAIAVADGLLVPVIKHADDLSVGGIARLRQDLVARAQSGKLRPDDLQGGTFTISNLGMYGIDTFNAIIQAPQAAILAVGALTDRVVAVAGQPAVRPMIALSLSCDHRVVDGARGAQFLATIADLITDPAGL